MKIPSPEKLVLGLAGCFMLAAIAFLVADLGLGVTGFRRWSAISLVIAAAIMFLPLVLLAVMLVIERLKPNKAEQDGAGQPPTRPESK
ncbi:hypothetical protein VSU19_00220 [Verrucomicrobiales bacterium BCK34]|nr:hypothetical protein [Verrucomicrobiales bacterium BCK34]